MSTKNEQIEYRLEQDYIELVKLIKIMRVAGSGGQAKQIIEQEMVFRNGVVETRKRAKIRRGEKIQVLSTLILVV